MALRGSHRRVAELGARRVVDRRRGALLDDLLVPALDRALALEEVDDVAVGVADDLDLDVARPACVGLDEQGPVAERRERLAAARTRRPPRASRRPRPPASPARRRRRRPSREAGSRCGATCLVAEQSSPVDRRHRSRRSGAPARLRRPWSPWPSSFEPIASITSAGGPDEREPGVGAGTGESGVLGEEPVAGVNGVRAGSVTRPRRSDRRAGTCRPAWNPGSRTDLVCGGDVWSARRRGPSRPRRRRCPPRARCA